MFMSGNFKDPNYKLKTINANMFFGKIFLLTNAKLPCKTINILKASN